MKRLARIIARLRTQDGGVILMFAILLPGILLLTAIALETGNWYEHRRHLQLQTDAGALAAGQVFRDCLDLSTQGNALTDMTRTAAQYGGDTATLAAVAPGLAAENVQVGSNGPAAGNVRNFSYQGTSYPPDYTPVANTDPCTSRVFDVRATEDNIPHIFKISPLATVHAHSRVELKAINELQGLLPLAVPDVRPKFVFATFIDESTGDPIAGCPASPLTPTLPCTEQLCPDTGCPDPDVPTPNTGLNTQTWIPKDAPLQVPIPAGDVGVRFRLVGSNNPDTPCGELYTECYDATSANGLVHVRGWDSNATAPAAHDVWLTDGGGSCVPDAYFPTGDCSAGIQADVDLGTGKPVDANTSVWATIDGDNTKYTLSPDSTGSPSTRWTLATGLPISGPGPHTIELSWSWHSSKGTFGEVQRAYVASPDSGPLQLAQVFEQMPDGSTLSLANTFKGGTTHTLGVTIKTIGNLLLSQPTDPPIYLRIFKSVSASQDQTINCDKDLPKFADELELGCSPRFIKNPSLQCPGGNANNLWDIWYVNHKPLPCAVIATGAKVGQVSQGLNNRIYGTQSPGPGDCASSPVNWIRNVGFDENAHADDKRALPLIVTPLGTFSGTGGGQVPVIDFAYFYVTGYKGDPCDGVDDNEDPVPQNRGAYVRGHFIKFFPIDDAVPSDDLCDFTSITPCIAVLTR
jgi:Flp pilus assembly protein TadG